MPVCPIGTKRDSGSVAFSPSDSVYTRSRFRCFADPQIDTQPGADRAKILAPHPRPLDSDAALSLHRGMSELPIITPQKMVERAAREARLAKALRDNLVRRKEQKRAQEGRAARQPQGRDREDEPPA